MFGFGFDSGSEIDSSDFIVLEGQVFKHAGFIDLFS